MSEAAYIRFVHGGKSKTGKTEIWRIEAKDAGIFLGEVRWFGKWTQYAFFPEPCKVFEKTCLRDIAAFCESMTRGQRQCAAASRRRGGEDEC